MTCTCKNDFIDFSICRKRRLVSNYSETVETSECALDSIMTSGLEN